MKTTVNKVAAMLVALALVLVGFTGLYLWQGASLAGPQHLCDPQSLMTMAADARRTGHEDVAAYREQEAEACRTDKVTVPAGDKKGDVNRPKADIYAPYAGEQLATARKKVSVNSHGPKYAVHPQFRGTLMDKLTKDQALQELMYRLPLSPSLTAQMGYETGVLQLNLNDLAKVDQLTKLFLRDHATWRKVVIQITARLRALDAQGKVILKTMPAGTYAATYTLVGKDGVPYLRVDMEVQRPKPFRALVVNGFANRLACGFQLYVQQPPAPTPTRERRVVNVPIPRMPTPVIPRDIEGTPIPPAHNPQPQPKPTPSTPSTSVPTTPTAMPSTPTDTPTTPSTTPPSLTPKDPSKDGGNRGARNEHQGPGAVTTPTQPPVATRTNPSGPAAHTKQPLEVARPATPAEPEADASPSSAPAQGVPDDPQ